MYLWLFWTLSVAVATSVAAPGAKLRHLSPVERLAYYGSFNDMVTLDFAIANEPHLSNIDRRWYVQNDPNARSILRSASPRFRDSRTLYSYLTRNGSAEYPDASLEFKVVLQPIDQDPARVNGEPVDDMVATSGRAYRKVTNAAGSTWRDVGYARFIVTNTTNELEFKGSFEVDDELGLGFPACVYHFSTPAQLRVGLSKREIDERAGAAQYAVWRDFDIRQSTREFTLANIHEYGPANYTFLNDIETTGLLKRSQDGNDTAGTGSAVSLYGSVGNTTGCPTKRQIALVGLLADCNYLQGFNNQQEVRQHLLDMINQASQLYESAFNITLGLSQVVIADNSSCPVTASADQPWNFRCSGEDDNALGTRLDSLSNWRTDHVNDSMATWSLMTSCDAGAVVGLSWLGAVCQSSGTSTAGANVVSRTSLDYLVIAHEIGHSFGAVHDCTSDTCAQGFANNGTCCPRTSSQCTLGDGQVFVMNPASTESISAFSACSQGNVCGNILKDYINSTCLMANTGGLNLYTNNTCGNGIVEEGEDCDCGGPEGCGENSCCDPNTCKFINNAVCDDSNDECCDKCQYASSTVQCRASVGECDHAEFCTGNSTGCPADTFVDDGTKCEINGTSDGYTCMSGHCSSRDLQCQSIMGSSSLNDGGKVSACSDDSSCQLTCQDSTVSNTCFSTNQNFLDGTPCRGSGKCFNGKCQGGSSSSNGGPGSNWWNNNNGDENAFMDKYRWIIVGVAGFLGALLLIFIIARIFSSVRSSPSIMKPVAPVPAPPAQAFSPPPDMARPAPGYYDRNFSPVQPNTLYYTDLPEPNVPPPPQPAYHPPNYGPYDSRY